LQDPYHDVVPNNWFDRESGDFREALKATIKGKEFVNTLSKRYFTSLRGSGRVAGGSLPHYKYINIPILNRQDPIEIPDQSSVDIPITLSDDFEVAAKKGLVPKATFFILVNERPENIKVACNKQFLSYDVIIHQDENVQTSRYLLHGEIPNTIFHRGVNLFTLSGQKQTVHDCWIDLDYPQKTHSSKLSK